MYRSKRGNAATWAVFLCAAGAVVVTTLADAASGQSLVSATTRRPFVIGFTPVANRGAVGGVSIDPQGIVARSDADTLGILRDARQRALQPIDTAIQTASPLRKVSLKGIVAELRRRQAAGEPVGDELEHLAGLVRIRLVLVYPDRGDIVLAGPAEGWKVDAEGNLVGRASGQPVLQLEDLVVALRTAENAARGEGITCSIDPTAVGLKRFQRVMGSRSLPQSEATVARLEAALGPQQVTVTGVPPESHFAQVLVAADFQMKRLAMNFQPAPIEGLPSYLDLIEASPGPAPRGAMPRFWMSPNYEPLLKDADGLAYELRGSGVQAQSEQGFLSREGAIVQGGGPEDLLARKWAETMTARYDELCTAMPIFGQLRGCIDLAVVSALLVKEDLPFRAGCDLALLLDEETIAVARYPRPETVASQASIIRKGRQWVVSISGGVDVDSWSVLDRSQQRSELTTIHQSAAPVEGKRWWWD